MAGTGSADGVSRGLSPGFLRGRELPAAITVEEVRAALRCRPAEVAWQAPEGRCVDARRAAPGEPVAGAAGSDRRRRPAAVLCALFDEGDQARVVLTRRSDRLRSHTGQVAFPGGRIEQGERPLDAALREAEEEVGLPRDGVEVLGQLSALTTRVSPAPIFPFVVALPGRPVLRPCRAEVARAFTAALVGLAAPGAYHCETLCTPGGGREGVHFFSVEGETVWGATAGVLVELMELVLAGGPATARPAASR